MGALHRSISKLWGRRKLGRNGSEGTGGHDEEGPLVPAERNRSNTPKEESRSQLCRSRPADTKSTRQSFAALRTGKRHRGVEI